MKKIVSLALVCVMLVCSMLALTSCFNNPASGKYESEGYQSIIKTGGVYEFSGSDVTYTAYVAGVKAYTVSGTYKVAKNAAGELEIAFTYESEGDDEEAKSGTLAYEKGEDYIKIGGTKYIAVD